MDPFARFSGNMDELILKSAHRKTSPDEEQQLLAWRAAGPNNEAYYADMVRLLAAVAEAADEGTLFVPDAADLIDTPGEEERPGRRRRPFGVAAAAAAALVVVSGGLYYTQRVDGDEFHMSAGEYVSGPNETTTATLADGTIVRLAPDSRLRIHDIPNRREVSLQGHAYFAVAHMPDRPFRVHTSVGDAIALGTRFDVRVAQDLRVVVVEGKVAVRTGREQVHVTAGEMSMVANGVVTKPVKVEVRPLVAWVGRFIAFQSTPLHEVAEELEAEYQTEVVITDSMLVNETITGAYTDRSLVEVITIICGVLGATCSVQNGTATIGR